MLGIHKTKNFYLTYQINKGNFKKRILFLFLRIQITL